MPNENKVPIERFQSTCLTLCIKAIIAMLQFENHQEWGILRVNLTASRGRQYYGYEDEHTGTSLKYVEKIIYLYLQSRNNYLQNY